MERIYCDGRPDHNLRLAICDETERAAIAPRAHGHSAEGGGDKSGALEEHGKASSAADRHVFLTYSGCGNGLPFHYSPVYSERYIRHIALAQVSKNVLCWSKNPVKGQSRVFWPAEYRQRGGRPGEGSSEEEGFLLRVTRAFCAAFSVNVAN